MEKTIRIVQITEITEITVSERPSRPCPPPVVVVTPTGEQVEIPGLRKASRSNVFPLRVRRMA